MVDLGTMGRIQIIILAHLLLASTCAAVEPTYVVPKTTLTLPFSSENGVPFEWWTEVGERCVDGFFVDDQDFIYLIGGSPTTLAKFSAAGKEVFRRSYANFRGAEIYVHGGKIYTLDISKNGKNTLYVLSAADGHIQDSTAMITTQALNSYCFVDEKLILQAFGSKVKNSDGPPLDYLVYDLHGEYLGPAMNPENLADSVRPVCDNCAGEPIYLGRYKGGYLFNDWDVDGDKYALFMTGNNGKPIARGEIPESFVGQQTYFGIGESWRLHGDMLSVIGRSDSLALITTFKVEDVLKR